MTDKTNFENLSSFSNNKNTSLNKTISFPALNQNNKSRVRLFIYFLVLMLVAFSFLVIGYKFSASNYARFNNQMPIGNTNIVSSTETSQKTDLTNILKSTVDITIFNDRYVADATGVIISADGYIVTNDHIYQDISSPEIYVTDCDGKQYEAQFIAGDSKYDISIIKINATDLTYAQFDGNFKLNKGDEIYSIGHTGSVSKGIVSGYVFEPSGQSKSVKMIRTDCAVNPGDSGGPVVSNGRLVAINCSKTVALDVEGMSYLLPANIVVKAIEQLINSNKITDRAVLGISYKYISPVYALQNNLTSGISIELINSDSDLYGKGFTNGDVIISIDGKSITSENTMLDCLSSHVAGDEIELTIKKINGTDRNVTIALSADSSFSCYLSE